MREPDPNLSDERCLTVAWRTIMNMKNHILAALREVYDRWEELLAGLSEEQITTPFAESNWSIKDEIAHLRVWQQRSVARNEAALLGREVIYPNWPAGLDPEGEGTNEQINAWIYTSNRDLPWSQVHQDWKEGFLRFLQTADGISERELLDGDRYPWLKGYPLAVFLLASYDHHQEHLEKLQTRLTEQAKTNG
jgi:hypothetical protein